MHQAATQPSPYLLMAAAVLALIGLLDSLYLSIERITGASLVCPVGDGCDIVQASAYSVLFGVPVAYMGVAGYLALLVLAILALNTDVMAGVPLPELLAGVASAGVIFSIYLTYLQVVVIEAICFWCVVSALSQLAIWVLALLHMRAVRRPRRRGAPAQPAASRARGKPARQ